MVILFSWKLDTENYQSLEEAAVKELIKIFKT